MNYLLDTHILLWARLDPQKLSRAYQDIISDKSSKKYFSTVSAWEMSLKYHLGKLDLSGHTPEEFFESALAIGYQPVTPAMNEMVSFYHLPATPGHKDPFDRMLIWQAIRQEFTLLSRDGKLPDYQIHGLKLAQHS